MPTNTKLDRAYKAARKALRADLNEAIATLERLQLDAIDAGNQEKADKYNDRLQEASAAKTLLIMTRVVDLVQTSAVQAAIAQIKKAEQDLDKTLSDEGLRSPEKLKKAKKIFTVINTLLTSVQKELKKDS